ncbi:MAG: transporter substrate-binding domain-containing protein [Deltaproteobacteria bacterium]|nr:transporter substrate-binding domain-containing protein [Deltaproteobacteria bacterium]
MRLRIITIGMLLWGLLVTGALAAPAKLTVALGSDSVPYYFQDQNALPSGLLVDLWKTWSQKTGIPVEFKAVAFAESLALVRRGAADIHAGCFKSEQRAKYLDFVTPVCQVQTNFFVHRNIFGVERVEDLRGLRVGVIAGDYALEYLASKLPAASLDIFPDNMALFQAIARGDILAFIKDTAIAVEQLSRLGILNQFRFDIERPLYERPWFAAVRHGNHQVADLVRRGMELISPPERAALELRWFKSTNFKASDRLVIACSKGFAPYSMLTPSGRPTGLLVDIWRLWAQKASQQIEFRFADWPGARRDLETGAADLHAGLPPAESQVGPLAYTTPFYAVHAGLFYNRKRLTITRLSDLAGQAVGVVADSLLDRQLRTSLPQAQIEVFPDTDALVHAAVDGSINAFAAELAPAARYLGELGEQDSFARLEGWQIKEPLAPGVLNGNQKLFALVEAGFKAISPQELAQLEERWIADPKLRYLGATSLRPYLSPQEKAWLQGHKLVLLGVAQGYPPLDFVSARGVHQGLAAEYLRLLGERLGIRFEAVSAFPWSEMLAKVRHKELGGVACLAQSPAREAYLRFSKPYFYSPYLVFARTDSPRIAKLADLAGQTVAVEEGFYLEAKLREEFPQIKLLITPDTRAALRAVDTGKAQGYVGNLLVAEYLLKQNPELKVKLACPAPWPGAELRIGIRKDWPLLVTILDKGLDSITIEEQAEINSKWLTSQTAELTGSLVMALTPKERDWLKKHPRLRLGVDPQWEPFEFVGPEKKYAGMASDYVHVLEDKLGIKMAMVPGLTWVQALAQARAGQIDIFACLARTPTREQILNFTKPYLQFPMVIVTKVDAPFLTALADLGGKTVAVGQGYASHEILASQHPDIRLHPVAEVKDGLRLVSQGEVDAFVGNLASVTHFTNQAGLTNLKIAASTPYTYDLCFGVRKDWPELVGILDRAISGISPGQKARIHNAWVSMRFEHGVNWNYVWKVIFAIVAVSLSALALFFYWNRRLQRVVNERRRAEEALSKSEAQLRGLVDSSADTIIAVDTQRRIIDCNQAFSEQFGFARPEVIGQSVRLIHEDEEAYERFGREVYPVITTAGSWRGEWSYKRKDGSILPMESVLSAWGGPDGAIHGYSAVMRDITERKLAEEAVRNSKQRLTEIIDFLPDPTWVVDNQGVVVAWNQALVELTGIPAADMLGQGDYAYSLPFYGHKRPVLIDLVRAWDESYRDQYLSIRRIGQSFIAESFHPHMGENGIYLSAVARELKDATGQRAGAIESLRDISDQKKVEAALEAARVELEDRVKRRTAELQEVVEALLEEVTEREQIEASLRKSEEEHRAVLEASPNCIIAYDTVGRAIYVNQAFTRIFGWLPEEVIGKRLDFVPATEREATLQAIKQVYQRQGAVLSFETKRYTKDGHLIDVSIHTAVFLDPKGEPLGMLVNLEDITARKQAEAELAQYREELERLVEERTAELAVAMEKAQEADRIKSAFLASMSHELRTPLNSIIGFTGIILQGLVGPLNEEQNKQMGMVQRSARHLLSLINDVLDISKIEAGQLKVEFLPFDLPQLVAEVQAGLEPLAEQRGLSLACRLAPEVGEVVSDRRRVEQILINLLNNALKFTDKGGVQLDCRVEDGWVKTSVTDTGIGIKLEDQAKLFQSFRQIDTGLSRRYEGTGLGLNICKKLVELLGGNIWVESQGEGQGSTFTFTLPGESRGQNA